MGLLLILGIHSAKAQSVHGYDKESNKDNIGISAGLAFSSSGPLIKQDFGGSNTAKGALSTVPSIGIYYQKGFGSRFSARIGFSLGVTSNAFKYSTKYDSIRADFSPAVKDGGGDYQKVKHTTGFIMPQIDLGYIFGPFKDMYLIEIRGGVGLQTYMGKSNDSTVWTDGSVTDRKNYTLKYHMAESASYGRPDVYGSIVTNIYAGFKWQKTTSPFLNNFAIGIQATLPVSLEKSGYSQLFYSDANYEIFSSEKVYFSQFSFGIKATYNIL